MKEVSRLKGLSPRKPLEAKYQSTEDKETSLLVSREKY